MKQTKKFALVLLALVLVLSLPFSAIAQEDDEIITVAFIQRTMTAPYYVAMWDTMAKMSLDQDFRLIALSPNLNIEIYAQQVEDLVSQGVDAIIVNALQPGTQAAIDEQIIEAGIPLIYIDTPVLDVESTAIVQSDNFTIGEGAGLAMAARLESEGVEEINLAILQGAPDDVKVGPDRQAGFLSGLEEGGITYEIVAEGWAAYSTEQGLTVAEDLITAHPEIDVMFGYNDAMVLGAMVALEEAGREDVLLAGVDGQKEALALISEFGCEGQYVSTGLNSPALAAQETVEIALSVIAGETTADDYEDVIFTEAVGIDCNNIDDYYDENSVF